MMLSMAALEPGPPARNRLFRGGHPGAPRMPRNGPKFRLAEVVSVSPPGRETRRSNVVASQDSVGSINGPVVHAMKIYLMQHGEALPKEVDSEEPLSPVGAAAVEATARAARSIGIRVDKLITSDKRRALETADLMADAVGVSKATIVASTLVKAMAPAGDAITYLESFSSLEAILVVGHLPSLAGIAGSLLSDGSPAVIQFERSGICRIDVDRLPTHGGRLRWHLTPALISMMR